MDTPRDNPGTWSSFEILRDGLRLFLPNRDDGENRLSTPSTRLYCQPEENHQMNRITQYSDHDQIDVSHETPSFPHSFQQKSHFSSMSDGMSVYSGPEERGSSSHDFRENSSGRSFGGWISLQDAQQAIESVTPSSEMGLLGEDCSGTLHEIEQEMQANQEIWVYREGVPAQLYKLPKNLDRAKRLFCTKIIERGQRHWFAIPKNVAGLELIGSASALEHLGKNLVIYGDESNHG